MPVQDGIITAPVSIRDIQRYCWVKMRRPILPTLDYEYRMSCDLGVLINKNVGDTIADTDGSTWTVVARGVINMWAKYKPVFSQDRNYDSQFDFDNNRWRDDADWFQGQFGTCGITPYTSHTFADIISHTNTVADNMNSWNYVKPSGGLLSVFRITDFIGYNHFALPAVSNFSGIDETAAGKPFYANCMLAQSGGDNVTLQDFEAELYFGVCFVDTNNDNAQCYYYVSDVVGGSSVSFDMPAVLPSTLVEDRTYRIVPFLCTAALGYGAGNVPTGGNPTFYTVPNVHTFSCKIISQAGYLNVVPSAKWLNGAHTSMRIFVKNLGSVNRYGAIYIRRSGHTEQDYAEGNDERNLGRQEFTANSTWDSGILTGFLSTYRYHVIVVVENGLVNQRYDINIMDYIEPDPVEFNE